MFIISTVAEFLPASVLWKIVNMILYGFASGDNVADGLIKMAKIIEKPGKENAPSQS